MLWRAFRGVQPTIAIDATGAHHNDADDKALAEAGRVDGDRKWDEIVDLTHRRST